MRKDTHHGQRRIAASAEALHSAPPVIIHTWGGFEVWLDAVFEQAERTEAGDLVYRFAVTSPQREFAVVRVEIPSPVQDELRHALGPRFSDDDVLWHTLAHNVLADTLDESPEVFAAGQLTVDDLNANQLNLVQRWDRNNGLR